MLYVSEKFLNIYGRYQYRTILKTDDFNEANTAFRAYSGKNEVTIDSSITGESIAVKIAS